MPATSAPQPVIRRAGLEQLARLQPLWESLHEHHVQVAPHLQQLGPVRTAAQSWEVRSALYQQWLAEPEAFALLAELDCTAVGYGVVHMRDAEESWSTGARIAELETLAVMPGHRGRGIGTALIIAVYAELRRIGVEQLGVSVISTNCDAIRFYEHLGLLPFCVSYIGNVPAAEASGR